MACVITYKNNKYSQQEFEKYFKNNFNEFINEFLSRDIEGFKDFIKNDVQQSFAIFEEEPFNSLPSRKDVYNQFKVWDNKLNRPKTWSMSVDRNNLIKIAQNINRSNKVYTAKIEQQPFLDKGKYLNKQYIQLTIKPEMNDLNNRLNIILDDNEKMEELMKTCKY